MKLFSAFYIIKQFKMKTKTKVIKHEAWLSTKTMHKDSLNWLSELKFAKDEQLFFDDLVKIYTLQLIDSKRFTKSKKIVEQLSFMQKETNSLIDRVIKHENGLKIMDDNVNQLEEEITYKDDHTKLKILISQFFEKYKILKTQLFSLVKAIIKEGKQKRLLQ
jgi:hypothetical protein